MIFQIHSYFKWIFNRKVHRNYTLFPIFMNYFFLFILNLIQNKYKMKKIKKKRFKFEMKDHISRIRNIISILLNLLCQFPIHCPQISQHLMNSFYWSSFFLPIAILHIHHARAVHPISTIISINQIIEQSR